MRRVGRGEQVASTLEEARVTVPELILPPDRSPAVGWGARGGGRGAHSDCRSPDGWRWCPERCPDKPCCPSHLQMSAAGGRRGSPTL